MSHVITGDGETILETERARDASIAYCKALLSKKYGRVVWTNTGLPMLDTVVAEHGATTEVPSVDLPDNPSREVRQAYAEGFVAGRGDLTVLTTKDVESFRLMTGPRDEFERQMKVLEHMHTGW